MFGKLSPEHLKKQISSGKFSFKSIVAFLIFGAIILVFVFFGFPTQNTGGLAYAALVNKSLISINDFRGEVQRVEQMYGPMFGGIGNLPEAQRQFLRQQALENLINKELVVQAANQEKIFASDEEVRDVIINQLPYFQRDGRFQREVYDQLLAANNLTKGDFESQIRKEQLSQKVRRLVDSASLATVQEMEKIRSLRETKYELQFARLEKEKFEASFQAPAEEVAKKLADSTFLTKAQNYFNANKSQYSTPESIRARHILIKTNPSDSASEKSALDKIKQLEEQLKTTDFAELAKKESQDQGSQKQGGDLGYFTKGKMVPAFEQKAFSMNVGELSGPVKTEYGYHLIKLIDKKTAVDKSFEEVKNEIAKKLLADEVFEQKVSELEKLLQQNESAGVEKSLQALGTKWESTGYFDLEALQIPQVGTNALPVIQEVSEKQPFYSRVVRESAGKFVLKFKDKKIEKLTDAESLAQSISQEKSFEVFGQWIDQTRKSAKITRNTDLLR